jgi:hypothetical protein
MSRVQKKKSADITRLTTHDDDYDICVLCAFIVLNLQDLSGME